MTRTDDLSELKRKAEAATPGPWSMSGVRGKINREDYHGVFRSNELTAKDEQIAVVWYDPKTHQGFADARYIAAASPSAILSLIARLEAAEAERDDARARARELEVVLDDAQNVAAELATMLPAGVAETVIRKFQTAILDDRALGTEALREDKGE